MSDITIQMQIPEAQLERIERDIPVACGGVQVAPRDIVVADADQQRDLPITLAITRAGETVFEGETSTTQLKRTLEEIAGWLTAELQFPEGVFLMTGTGIVPPDDFSLAEGDSVRIQVGSLVLENPVTR